MLARATSIPSLSATTVGPEPGRADDPVEDEVGAGGGDQLADPLLAGEHPAAPGVARPLGRVGVGERDRRDAVLARLLERRSQLEPAASPTTCSSSERATISSACVPIDPVRPRITTSSWH